MIQYELELHWLTTVAGSQGVFCLCCTNVELCWTNVCFVSLYGYTFFSDGTGMYISISPGLLACSVVEVALPP